MCFWRRAADPAADYEVVRQELALYNPQYCARPHVVALNKMDLPDAGELHREIAKDVLAVAMRMQVTSRVAAAPGDLVIVHLQGGRRQMISSLCIDAFCFRLFKGRERRTTRVASCTNPCRHTLVVPDAARPAQ